VSFKKGGGSPIVERITAPSLPTISVPSRTIGKDPSLGKKDSFLRNLGKRKNLEDQLRAQETRLGRRGEKKALEGTVEANV